MIVWFGLDGQPTDEATAMRLFENPLARCLAAHGIDTGAERIAISTMFLVLNQAFLGPPVLWETKVFGGTLDGRILRYASREQAAEGHELMVSEVKQALRAAGCKVIAEQTFTPSLGVITRAGPDA